MYISEYLSLERTCYKATVTSKKKTLELIAETIAADFTNIQSHEVFDALVEREKLGSTGMGHGIAIPHARLKSADSVILCLILLDKPVDFDSIDKEPVDLLMALIVPKEEDTQHLEALSFIAEKFRDSAYCEKLRKAKSLEDLYKKALEI